MLRYAVLTLLCAAPASAANFTDRFGSTVLDCSTAACTDGAGAGMWQRSGVTIGPMGRAQAGNVMDSLAPDGWTPPAPAASTEIETTDFVARFTPAEISALLAWNPAMVFQVASAKVINLTSPKLRAGLAAAVAAGKLTQTRVDQLLTP